VVGANQADTLMGTSAPDVIVSHGGRDVITADTRGDRVCADGTDNVYAGSDNPHVFGVGYDYLLAGHGMCKGPNSIDFTRCQSDSGFTPAVSEPGG
jgi:hypothetical protein